MKLAHYFHSFLFLLLIVASQSCIKDNQFSNLQQDNPSIAERDVCTTEFSSSEVNSIGILHNQVVVDLFEHFNFQASDKMAELTNQLSLSHPELSTSKINSIVSTATSSLNFNINNYSSQIGNPLVYQFFNILLGHIDNYQSISGLNSSLDQLKIQVETNLDCKDKSFMLTCISVARNSAILWTPTVLGGIGFHDELKVRGGFSNGVEDRDSPWRKAAKADLLGAAGAFFAYGFGLVVPGANAAIAADIAFAAGYSSATAFF